MGILATQKKRIAAAAAKTVLLAKEEKLEAQISELQPKSDELAAQRKRMHEIRATLNDASRKADFRAYTQHLVRFIMGEPLDDKTLRDGVIVLLKERWADEIKTAIQEQTKPISEAEAEVNAKLYSLRVELQAVQNEILS